MFTKLTTNTSTNLRSLYPKLLTWTVSHLNSTRNNFIWNITLPWKRFFAVSKPRITEITEVSIPGIDATVIVDVLNQQITNNYANIVSILTVFYKNLNE